MRKPFLLFVLCVVAFGIGCIAYKALYGDWLPEARAEVCAPIDVCFNPNGKCDEKVFKFLDQFVHAKKNIPIRVNTYLLSNSNFSGRFTDLATRGHDVRVLYDRSCEEGFLASSCKIGTMPGVLTKRVELSGAINHNKYIIIGNHLVITGSANLTKQAFTKNLENVVFIWDRDIVNKYIQDFDKTWERF